MAITHGDLSLRKFRSTDVSGKLALFLVIFSVLCGIATFIICLLAEGARSEVLQLATICSVSCTLFVSYVPIYTLQAIWLFMTSQDGNNGYRCIYSSSGRVPLACAVAAFLVLAVAMFAEHAYMLVAITSPQLPITGSRQAPRDPGLARPTKELTWQVCCLFLTTWICFALAEILLMIGIGVESGHLSNWTVERFNCHVIRPGVFSVAGVFGLITVFLGVGLYLTALRTVRLHLEGANMGRARIPDVSHQYPHLQPTAPGAPQVAVGAQHSQQQHPQDLEKISTSA